MPKYYIYTLELENNKVYVGVTNNLAKRYKQHATGKGANYTRKHRPIRIASYFEVQAASFGEACIYEDARALEVIFNVGIISARGGRFFSPRSKIGKLKKHYSDIDKKYKNIPQVKYKGKHTSLAGIKLSSNKKKSQDMWAKQVLVAKNQLRIANQRFV